MIKSLGVVLLLVGCRVTTTHVPSTTPTSYTPYEHQMLKVWEEVGKKFEAGEYHQALEGYQKFLEEYPYSRWSNMAYYFMGECYERLRNYDQARLMYRSVMDKYPGSVWADLARDRMVQLP